MLFTRSGLFVLGCLLFFSVGVLSGCGPTTGLSISEPEEAEDPPRESESVDPNCLHVVVRSGGLTLDPPMIRCDDVASAVVARQMYRGLVRPIPEGIEPDLAVDWSSSDGGWTWDVFLDPEATFHDGTPVTADAIRRAWLPALTTEPDSPLATPLVGVADIVAADVHTLRFHLSHPDGEFVSAVLTSPNMLVGSPVEGGVPLGTGDYRYGGFTPEGSVILRAVDGQDFRSVIFHALPPDVDLSDPDTWDPGVQDLFDRAGVIMYLRPEEASPVAVRLGMHIESLAELNVRGLVLNHRRTPLGDVEVRSALFHAIGDAISLLEEPDEFSRHLLPISSWLPAEHPLNATVTRPMGRPWDPELTEDALELAGMWRTENGSLVYGGIADLPIPLNLQMIAPEGVYAGGETVARRISDRLIDAGFAVDLEILPWSRFLARYFPGEYDLALVGWAEHSPAGSAFLFPWLHSAGGVTVNTADHLRIDDLLLDARAAGSEDERAKKYAEVLEIAADACLLLPLYTTPAIHALRGDLLPLGPFTSFRRDE